MTLWEMLFLLCFIFMLIPCFPTPYSWWKFRIKQVGETFFPQAFGVLKPWWHPLYDCEGSAVRFATPS